MLWSSESVAAIATALAKAQIDLSNPEKAMVGTVYNNRSDSLESFRYASLASVLIPEQVAHLFQDDAAHLFRLIVARHSD